MAEEAVAEMAKVEEATAMVGEEKVEVATAMAEEGRAEVANPTRWGCRPPWNH